METEKYKKNFEDFDIQNLIETYRTTLDVTKKKEAKNLVVNHMIPIVKRIAKTIARRANDPVDDLVQAGFIGLLKAMDYYKYEKNNNFRVYAGYLIIGEIKHYLRDKLNAIKVPRHIQELIIRINNFTSTLTQEELQKLTSDDVADALHVPVKAVDFVLQVDRRRTTLSLDEMFSGDNTLGYEEMISDKNYNEKTILNDAKIIFNDIIDILPDEEKVLVDMYYSQDMNQKEIAESLGISQMKVSRNLKHAFETIYYYYEGLNKNSSNKT